MNEKEMLMKQLRANAFPHNNGKVMQAINIIRHSYKKQEELRQTVERQQCYISGLEYALRHMTPTVVVESHEKETKEKAG